VSNLSAAETFADDTYDDQHAPEPLGLAPDPVEIRRNGGVAAAVGGLASAVAIAYLARATSTGAWLDWALFALMGALGVAYLVAFVDARTPLLVADAQGVRIRLGKTWRGLPWGAIEHVEHQPRRGLLRDGRLVLVATEPQRVLDDLDSAGRRQAAVAARLHGSPLAIPLALSTRVTGADGDLTDALARLADDPAQVLEVASEVSEEVEDGAETEYVAAHEPEAPLTDAEPGDEHDEPQLEPDDEPHGPRLLDPRPALARGIGFLAERLRLRPARDVPTDEDLDEDPVEDPEEDLDGDLPGAPAEHVSPAALVASATPIPLRDPVTAARAEVRFEGAAALHPDPADDDQDSTTFLPESRQLRRPGSVDLVEDTVVWTDRVRPIARAGDPVAPLVIDDFDVEPAQDPVVGPELAAARTRLSLTVDQLAERTRIRPHVIESIEVDDFAPCGGDFYARGHLRTLARVLGVDATPLLAAYDERYSDAPIDARRVFEAELATGVDGPIRGTRGGPNWSVLVAAVMAIVLAWSIARLVMDSPVELHTKPVLNGSPSSPAKLGPPVPVVLDASAGGAHVVVRDGAGDVVFNGDLAYGASKAVKASPPVRVQSSDGALQIKVDGKDRGPLGADGQPAQNTFTVGD
jgi:cytoskeleton protein RodZ